MQKYLTYFLVQNDSSLITVEKTEKKTPNISHIIIDFHEE